MSRISLFVSRFGPPLREIRSLPHACVVSRDSTKVRCIKTMKTCKKAEQPSWPELLMHFRDRDELDDSPPFARTFSLQRGCVKMQDLAFLHYTIIIENSRNYAIQCERHFSFFRKYDFTLNSSYTKVISRFELIDS